MTEIDYDLYRAKETTYTAVRATWLNPHPSKAGTPVEQGGIVWPAEPGVPVPPGVQTFEVRYANGATQTVHGARGITIIPVRMTGQYTVVYSADPSVRAQVVVPAALYVRSADVPDGYRVASAVTLFFVISDDLSGMVYHVQFRSHLASAADKSYRQWARTVARMGQSLLTLPLDVRALPVKFGAGETMLVGRVQKAPVARPVFMPVRNYASKDELLADLVPQQRYLDLLDAAADPMIATYPALPGAHVSTLADAYAMLRSGGNAEQSAAALPAPAPAQSAADETYFF